MTESIAIIKKYRDQKISLEERNKLLIEINNRLPCIPKEEYIRRRKIEEEIDMEVCDCMIYGDIYHIPYGDWCDYCRDKDPRDYKNCTSCKLDFLPNRKYKGKKMICKRCIKSKSTRCIINSPRFFLRD